MGKVKAGGKGLVLIDGHSLAFRAFHALPLDLSTSKGELTNAVYGFMSMLLNVLRTAKPDYIGVAFDVGRTFRHESYPDYKAQRLEMPQELAHQLERIKELLDAFGIPIFMLENYEADDVLGTLSRRASEQGVHTLIVTGDTDAFQLVDSMVRVMISGRRFSDISIYDEKAVRERYGLSPDQLIDFKALAGDKSDNIPGVFGIGEKTATQLLQTYGSLDSIYDHLDEISKKRTKQALQEQREQAYLSRELVRIIRDADIPLDLETCQLGNHDREKVKNLFRDLEFRSLLERLAETGIQADAAEEGSGQQLAMFQSAEAPVHDAGPAASVGEYDILSDSEQLGRLADQGKDVAVVSFDTETTSTNPLRAELVGMSLALAAGKGYYIPTGHTEGKQLSLETVRDQLNPLLSNPDTLKVGHNAIYDLIVLRRHGFSLNGRLFDTMVAEWLIDPTSRNLALKNLAWSRLGLEMTPITDLIGRGKQQGSMANVPIERAGPYAAADADVTLRLYQQLERELKDKKLWPLFFDIEMPLIPVLADMEQTGIKLDSRFLQTMSAELDERMRELQGQIQDAVGYAFNIRSTKQLSEALFVHLGLPSQGLRKTESGSFSTSADVLESLVGEHPVVEMILEHRQLAKLKSTYLDILPALVNPDSGRVHTSLNQTGTVTGRISSSDPNLQNIPIRTQLGRRVRRAFIAEDGWLLLSADYSQVELRILAHISGDETLLAAFQRGEDIHAFTAATIFGKPLSGVTPEMRRIAKTTNFAIVYGVTGYGLSQQTSLSRGEADQFIKAYFQQYPQVKEYLDRCRVEAAKRGYVETLLGRRRYFPELQSTQRAPAGLRAAAERMAINMPIQGTAADIIKIAMIRLHEELSKHRLQSRLLLQVHDELLLEIPEDELDRVPDMVRDTMEGAYQLRAPLKVDRKLGHNWNEMTRL